MVEQGFLGLSSGVARGRPWLAQVADNLGPTPGAVAAAGPARRGANSGSFTFVSSPPLPGSRWVGQVGPDAYAALPPCDEAVA